MDFPKTHELNKRVKLRAKQEAPVGAFGMQTTYDAGIDLWAKIEPVGGAIYFGTMQVDAAVTHRIWIRYRIGVTGDHVIDHISESKRYRIRRYSDLKGAKRFLLIEAEELQISAGA